MKSFVPDGSGQVRLADIDEVIAAPAEAIVAVEAFSVNRGETFLLEDPPAGWRPGKDIAGRVVQAAAGGAGPRAGTRVLGHPPSRGWAERVAVPVGMLAGLPDAVTTTTAAALPLAGLTALRLVRAAGPLIGRRLLITGASGGVGHYVTELAVASGAEVTAVSASPERGAALAALGATVVADPAGAPGRYDIVMESVGGQSLVTAQRKARAGGVVLWFGQARRHPRLARASARLAVAVDALFESDGWGGPGEEPRVSEVWKAIEAVVSRAELRAALALVAGSVPPPGVDDDWRPPSPVKQAAPRETTQPGSPRPEAGRSHWR